MSRLGDGRGFASGVAQNSRARGRFDVSRVMFCLFIKFLLLSFVKPLPFVYSTRLK